VSEQVLGELFTLVDSYPDTELKLVCCDTEPVLIGEYTGRDLPDPGEIELVGGGGTSLGKLGKFVEDNGFDPTFGGSISPMGASIIGVMSCRFLSW
jgi:predicted metal-dependent peptidase